MIFALVRLSAVSAVLAENRVAKREKVKNKPTEQRDVRDVESSEETGDYTDCESNPAPTQTFLASKEALRRCAELQLVGKRMREQVVLLRGFFSSDHETNPILDLIKLKTTPGTLPDDEGMSSGLDHQTQAANHRPKKDTPDKHERDPSTDSNLSRPLKSSRTAVAKATCTMHEDELGGEYSEEDKQQATNAMMSAQPQHPPGSLDSTNNRTGTNSTNVFASLDEYAATLLD
jgi:hypothetical protein